MAGTSDYNVAIVGGGMVGVSLALSLARSLPADARIVLLESFPLPAQAPDFTAAYSPSFDARSTATAAAFSHDSLLVPTISITL